MATQQHQLDKRYRVIRKLGEGGMGEVFLAEHVTLGRQQAIKVLRADLHKDHELIARFRREARANHRVQHANVVAVHDFGQLLDGRLYLAMEYVDGENLEKVIRESGGLPLSRAVPILRQLAEAIEHAHQHGVVHRDLKPDNMILERRNDREIVKVLDFGIAKIVAADHKETMALTKQGETFGTPEYMSPEQFAGHGSDPRIDWYAFGCIAYQLVVGHPPFTGRRMEIVHGHLTQAPKPPSVAAPTKNVPPEFDHFVMRCLVKNPEQRVQNGTEVLAELARVPIQRTTKTGISVQDDGANDVTLQSSPNSDFGVGRYERRRIIEELVEELIDLGYVDADLSLRLAALRLREDDALRLRQSSASYTQRVDAAEQGVREREGSLRFQLGELSFVRARVKTPKELQALDELTVRIENKLNALAEELSVSLRAITDDDIGKAAQLAELETSLDLDWNELRARVARSVSTKAEASLHVRLAQLRG